MKLVRKYSEINKELAKEVQELKKKLIKNKEHFDHYEKDKITMQKNTSELEDEIHRLNNENDKILNTLKEEYRKSNLKDTELNVYLEEKKSMKQKLQDNNKKIT